MTIVTDLELPFLDTHDPRYQADPTPTYRKAHELGDWIMRIPEGFGILSYQDAAAILRHPGFGVFFSVEAAQSDYLALRTSENILSFRGKEHARLRRLAWPAFRPKEIEHWRPHVVEVINTLVDRVMPAGACDFIEQISEPYPLIVTAPILGIPLEEAERLAPLSHDWIKIFDFPHHPQNVAVIEQAWRDLESGLDGVVKYRRRHLGDDLLSLMIEAEDQGDRLSHDELIMLLVSLFVGALDTTRHQMSLGIGDFLEHPDQWERLRSRPELASGAVEEVMRYSSTIHSIGRVAIEHLEYRDILFPESTVVLIFVRSANRDPTVFADPNSFDIDRRSDHVTFGGGPHFCLGAPLARVELAEGLVALSKRWKRIERAGEPRYLPATGNFGATCLPLVFEGA
jgi:cytochrome P450